MSLFDLGIYAYKSGGLAWGHRRGHRVREPDFVSPGLRFFLTFFKKTWLVPCPSSKLGERGQKRRTCRRWAPAAARQCELLVAIWCALQPRSPGARSQDQSSWFPGTYFPRAAMALQSNPRLRVAAEAKARPWQIDHRLPRSVRRSTAPRPRRFRWPRLPVHMQPQRPRHHPALGATDTTLVSHEGGRGCKTRVVCAQSLHTCVPAQPHMHMQHVIC